MDVKFDFNQVLEQLAVAFNTTVEKLLPVLIQQAYVYGISWAVGLIFAWAVVISLVIVNKKCGMKRDKDGDLKDSSVALMVVSIAVTFVSILITAIGMTEMLTALLNPEYWALKEVLSYIK